MPICHIDATLDTRGTTFCYGKFLFSVFVVKRDGDMEISCWRLLQIAATNIAAVGSLQQTISHAATLPVLGAANASMRWKQLKTSLYQAQGENLKSYPYCSSKSSNFISIQPESLPIILKRKKFRRRHNSFDLHDIIHRCCCTLGLINLM